MLDDEELNSVEFEVFVSVVRDEIDLDSHCLFFSLSS